MSPDRGQAPQRRRILDSAVRILADEGATGLTVRAVAEASDCSTTGIYTYFGGKDGLLEAIFRDGVRRFRAHVGAEDEVPGADAADRLRRAMRRYGEWALANPTHYLLMFAPSGFDASPESRTEAVAGFEDLVRRVAAVAPDLPGPEVDRAAYHLWAALHGHVMLRLTGRHPVDLDLDDAFASAVEDLVAGLA